METTIMVTAVLMLVIIHFYSHYVYGKKMKELESDVIYYKQGMMDAMEKCVEYEAKRLSTNGINLLHHQTVKAIRKITQKENPSLVEISVIKLSDLKKENGFNKTGKRRLEYLLDLVGLEINNN